MASSRSRGLATMLMSVHGIHGHGGRYTQFLSNLPHPLSTLARRYKASGSWSNSRVHPPYRRITKAYDLDANPDTKIFSVPKSLEPVIVFRLLPSCLLARLMSDPELEIHMRDGRGSAYDAPSAAIELKGTDDAFHEVGHHVWNYYLPRAGETLQRDAVIHSLDDGADQRREIPPDLIPQAHLRYGRLVGAFDGQRLTNAPIVRANDLEEHFARNFDYLAKRKPLAILEGHHDPPDIGEFLGFYSALGLVDGEFIASYLHIVQKLHGHYFYPSSTLSFQDGDPVTIGRIALIHVMDEERRLGKPLPLVEEVALRADLTLPFVIFALEGNPAAIIETLRLYRTDTPALVDRILARR